MRAHNIEDLVEEIKRAKNNPTTPMKKFKKHEAGGLYIGMRFGSFSHMRIGRLVRGYYTINWPWWNCAWVLKCEDGIERSYQGIQKITEGDVDRIHKERESYLKQRNEGGKNE